MKKWSDRFENKKIVLLGFGREGRSTLDFLLKHISDITIQIMDQNVEYVKETIKGYGMPLVVTESEKYLQFDDDIDFVFKSPGIPLKDLYGKIDLKKVTSQSNEFLREYHDYIIGVTGTKGKSTTCAFMYELLKKTGVEVQLVGNIGIPPFDLIDFEKTTPLYVYEMSSHQLETVKYSPRIGVVLNLFEEHLDHYTSYDAYAEAKMNIGRYQSKGDYFIYRALNDEISHRMDGFKGNSYGIFNETSRKKEQAVTVESLADGIYLKDDRVRVLFSMEINDIPFDIKRELIGKHNLLNMAVCLLIYKILGYKDYDTFIELVESFKGLPHRLSRVATIDGITYYNDSISTIPQATIAAAEGIKETETIILGGMDRGIDYALLIDWINVHKEIKCILMPDTGHKLYENLKEKSRLYKAENLDEAVQIAAKVTSKGKACLLSPAASSYGFFENFEDRGECYESLVKALAK